MIPSLCLGYTHIPFLHLYKMASSDVDAKMKRVANCIQNKVNFISGTVTPAQSRKQKDAPNCADDIECLDIGVQYLYNMYKNKMLKTANGACEAQSLVLSIQPKFMGSRSNMYLFRDDHLSRSYCVSRNGYVCKLPKEQMRPLYQMMRDRLNDFMTENKVTMLILDGELLPWSALGHGLIEHDFLPVDTGLKTEIEYMKKYGFDQVLSSINDAMSEIHQAVDNAKKEGTKKKEIEAKFGKDAMKNYEKHSELLTIPTTGEIEKMYQTYHQQMMLYTEGFTAIDDAPIVLSYKPFSILKICFEDGSESIPLVDQSYSQSEMYDLLVDKTCDSDAQLVVEINDSNFNEAVAKIQQFFTNLTYQHGFEGVMIKPDYVVSGCLPMMKCRNTSYLTIIYGYDYMREPKLSRLIKNKTTSTKIKQSIREFETGMQMLKVPYSEITSDPEYQKILMKFLYVEELGSTIDPRL